MALVRSDIREVAIRFADGSMGKVDYFAARADAPLVVLIHGGGWVSGSRSELHPHARALVRQGINAASIDYRLATKHIWPAQIDDCRAVVRQLKSKAKYLGFDTRRVAAAGESAGGHLSMWLGVYGDVQAVGSVSGLHDLRVPMTPTGESYQIVQKALGRNYPAKVADFSPLLKVGRTYPRTYFIHGAKDPWVPMEHTRVAERKLRELKRPFRTEIVATMGHGLKLANAPERAAWDRFARWLLSEWK